MRIGGSELGGFVPSEDEVENAIENFATCILEKPHNDCQDTLIVLAIGL